MLLEISNDDGPADVKARDLRPEIDVTEGILQAAYIISNFLNAQAGDNGAAVTMQKITRAAGDDLRPIQVAYKYEGSRHFNAPNQIGGPAQECPKGLCDGLAFSQWSVFAQQYVSMADEIHKEGFLLSVTNNFVDLTSVPPLGAYHNPNLTLHDNV